MSGRTRILALPGAGSSGLAWDGVASLTGATVHPLLDSSEIDQIVVDAAAAARRLDEDLLLVGASLGAIVAVELTRRHPVRGLVLMASGPEIRVSPGVLDMAQDMDEATLTQVARSGVSSSRRDLFAQREHDLRAREPGVLLRHLTALASYQPSEVPHPPPTVVLWGEEDSSVGLGAHLRLAAACAGYLRPLTGVGHSAYLEAPEEVHQAIRYVDRLAEMRKQSND